MVQRSSNSSKGSKEFKGVQRSSKWFKGVQKVSKAYKGDSVELI